MDKLLDFSILDLQTPSDRRRVERRLCSALDFGPSDRHFQKHLFEVLARTSKTVIIEHGYFDFDWTASYVRFHYRHFRNAGMKCDRYHFFSRGLPNGASTDALARMSRSIKDNYLGFLVMRPLPECFLGRGVFSEKLLRRCLPAKFQQAAYLTCKTLYRTHLAGNEISLEGCPWMQQDGHVSACATIAIWVASYHLAHRFPYEFRRFSTAEITDLAHRTFAPHGRAMPSTGLSPEQIVHALASMGFDPITSYPSKASMARRGIYQYVESGIPVILQLKDFKGNRDQDHAVTVVGHTLHKHNDWPDIVKERGVDDSIYCFSSDAVPAFVVQDDIRGPFLTATLEDTQQTPDGLSVRLFALPSAHADQAEEGSKQAAETESQILVTITDSLSQSKRYYLDGFVVPLPAAVTLTGIEAENKARSLAQSFLLDIAAADQLPLLGHLGHIVVRTTLQKSNDLKAGWFANGAGRPVDVGQHLRCHQLPRWVWVTEFADPEEWASEEVHGLLIQDSSGLPTIKTLRGVEVFQYREQMHLVGLDGRPRHEAVRGRPYKCLDRYLGYPDP